MAAEVTAAGITMMMDMKVQRWVVITVTGTIMMDMKVQRRVVITAAGTKMMVV